MTGDEERNLWFTPERILLVGFLLVLAWAPFPYGSNRPWAELALGFGFGAILLLWSAVALTGIVAVVPQLRRLLWPGLCVAVALGWAGVQAIDLAFIKQLTGIDLLSLAHPIWQMAQTTLGEKMGAYVSVDPELTRQSIFAGALSVAAFLIAFELARDRERAAILVVGVIVIALLYAAVGMAGYYTQFDYQSWLMPDPKMGSNRLAGPFVNPNHYATFMGLGAVAALGLFAETLRQAVVWDRGWRLLLRTSLQAVTGPATLWLIAIVTITSALLLTQSRGGVIAFFAGTIALTVALAAGRRASSGEASGQRAMAAVLVAVLGVAAAVSADPILGRVRAEGVGDSARASLAQSAVEAIQAAPLMGHGFGAFERYYPYFSDGTVPGTVDEAHNDLLEALSDLGLPAGLAYLAAPILLAWMCFQGCLNRRRDRLYPALGFAVSVLVGIHAAVEFSLQVPAVAVMYAALLGLGVAQSWRTNMDIVR
jgi:O-antigen ligase